MLSAALAACLVLRSTNGDAAPALPGDSCQVEPRTIWSETEKWVWSQVCGGAIADLHVPFGSGLDPRSPEGWTVERKLSSGFLETILLRDPWRGAIPRQGVHIIGAWFEEPVDLAGAEIAHQLSLEEARLTSDVDLRRIRTKSLVSLDGSAVVTGTLNMDGASIGSDLFMRAGAEFGEVILRGAKIGEQLSLIGAKVGTLNMDGASIGDALFMRAGAEFAEVILRAAKIAGQLDMTDAKVTDTLNMDSASIGNDLFMRFGAEFADVILVGAQIGGQLDMTDAKIAGTLDMDSTNIGGPLFMREDAEFAEVIMPAAKIGGQLDMNDVKVAGTLNMDGASIGSDLYMIGAKVGTLDMDRADIDRSLLMYSTPEQRAEFNEVRLVGASVGGDVNLDGAKVAGTLDLDSAKIGSDLFMRSNREQRAEFNEVRLVGARVGGSVELDGAKVTGALDMEAIDIGQYLFLRSDFGEPVFRAEFDQPINLTFARIGGALNFAGAALSSLDLTGTTIEGPLGVAFPSWSPQWRDDARLVLRHASVDVIQDTTEESVWPPQLDLDGLNYRGFGESNVDVATRGSAWFVNWLAKDNPYSPQPYEQLGRVLREMGHGEEANDVLFAGRERARKRACEDGPYGSCLGLWALRLTIGYGYGWGYFRSLGWVVFFVALGSGICVWSRYGPPRWRRTRHSTWRAGWRKWRFPFDTCIYSLDQLLPIIQLSRHHDDIRLRVGARYYFYFHKVMGFVLASFLVAGLAGLTK
jgi:uncharacterized protein YjbI with pentapeptide repeats